MRDDRGSPPPPRHQPLAFEHRRTASKIRRCKKGARSDLKPDEWDKYGYGANDEVLTRPINYDSQTIPIPRIKREDISPKWFHENIASKGRPVIIEDAINHWPAIERWSLDALDERFGNVEFMVAKDSDGKKLRMKLKYYIDYMKHQKDDSPLFLFESDIEANILRRQLCRDFEVPDLFPHDFLNLVNDAARPPSRWWLLGPRRSGLGPHVDPFGTDSWLGLTHGCKRWALMEPSETKRVVKGKDVLRKGEDDETIMYFDFILPRIKKQHPQLKVWEGRQYAGEVMFVPGSWWYAVLNEQNTAAVTQNYVGPGNFDLVWTHMRREREKVAGLWLRNMRRFAPALHERALELNRKDGFRMRHERPKGERLPDCASSDSGSSSDSSSDEAVDLNPVGLDAVVGPDLTLGVSALQRQGNSLPAPLFEPARCKFPRPAPADADAAARKRRRVAEDLLAAFPELQ